MPRKAKEKKEEIEEKAVKKTTKATKSIKVASKKMDAPKKTAVKKVATKKISSKESTPKKKVATKKVVKKAVTKEKKSPTTKKAAEKKVVTKKNTGKKTTVRNTAKQTSSKKASVKKITPSKEKFEVLEYYDLPYRYNQTVVKILAQTPTTLFVYWDISDENKEQYIKQYGEYFFNNTKPVLIIYNKTKNYSFEVDINDFANSWYLHVSDSNCDYQVELGRRPINQYVEIPNNYLQITISNDIVSQNDHILFDKLSHFVYFRNVKTNETYQKDITTSLTLLQKIGKFNINFIKEFYKKLYPDESIDFDRLDLRNQSSATSNFK